MCWGVEATADRFWGAGAGLVSRHYHTISAVRGD